MDAARGWSALLDPGSADDFFADAARVGPPVAGASWHAPTAWWLAELARIAYRREGRAERLRAAGWREAWHAERDGTLATFTVHERTPACAVLAFRGTTSLRDWFVNVRALRRAWAGPGRVHYGFRRAFSRIWPDIAPRLREAPVPLLFTGHSLGGALALLAATLHAPRATYTFGAPRVGDEAFTAALPPGVHRVVNGRDVVPELPPLPRLGGFTHGGELHELASPHATATAHDVVAAAAALRSARRRFAPPPALADHAPADYIRRLAALATTLAT